LGYGVAEVAAHEQRGGQRGAESEYPKSFGVHTSVLL
jgi:hypothetical protein